MTVRIVEVIRRADQGVTRPFLCRGEDGSLYFVKGRSTGHRSLICEWLAGQLALALGLPVAQFKIVDVPRELVDLGVPADVADLGNGLAFGSRRRPVIELSAGHLAHVPADMQRDVLAFDWWVRNLDRTLSTVGGNPNLFWDTEAERLLVLDHNQAFDPAFSVAELLRHHAFRAQADALLADWVAREAYRKRFLEAVTYWPAFCQTVPAEWWFADPEQTVPTDFDRDAAQASLLRCQDDDFWSPT